MKHKNIGGIDCFVFEKPGFAEKHAKVAVRFGSDISAFVSNGKKYDLPKGTAHFIEHKMFDMENGNIMGEFVASGADVNAYTTFDHTAYYFDCTENFTKNLELLLKMVSAPCFFPESIAAEKKIIAREINMYGDDPQWKCYFSLLSNMFPQNAVSDLIAGTEDEIEKIDAEIMYACYDAFYTPSNIALIAAGDIRAEELFETAEKCFSLPCDKETELPQGSDMPVSEKFSYAEHDLKVPYFYAGIKLPSQPLSAEERVKVHIALDLAAGECSPLYKKLYDAKILDAPLRLEYLAGRNYRAALFSGNSEYPEKAAEEIFKAAENIDKSLLQTVIKKQRGGLFMQQDSLDGLSTLVADCFAKNINFLDFCGLYDKMEKENNLCFDMNGEKVLSVVSGKR